MHHYPKANYIQRWLGGELSKVTSSDTLQSVQMFELDVDTWGRILDAELTRWNMPQNMAYKCI